MLIFFIAWRNAKRWNSRNGLKEIWKKNIKEKQIKRKRDMATKKKMQSKNGKSL